jgi:hypothetical protein
MVNTKNINWVDSAELKAVRIDKHYGKTETYTSLILMSIVLFLAVSVISSFFIINYGDIVLQKIRAFVSQGNFFNISLYVLSALALIVFLALLWFSISGLRKTRVGIIHQVNTTDNFTLNIVSIVISSIGIILLIALTIFRIILLSKM